MKKIFTRLGLALLLAGTVQCSGDGNGTPEEDVRIDRSANLLTTGESALDFLTSTSFETLRVQVAYADGARPTQGSLDNLEAFLLSRTQKAQVSIELLPLPASGQDEVSLQEIAQLENDNRTAFNNGTTLALYIYFTDALAEGDSENDTSITLGAVYRNTSMVIYQRAIGFLANRTLLVSREELEGATLMHEMGHLFGLVNLNPDFSADFPHGEEDPEAANHCGEAGCLMQASLEFSGSAGKLMESRALKGLSPIPDLGPECLRVLREMGGR